MRRHSCPSHLLRSQQAGFSLLEVAIALLLLSMVLLGSAHWHLQALQYQQQAIWHARAHQLAWDLANTLQAAPAQSAAEAIDAWQARVHTLLPHTRTQVCPGDARKAWQCQAGSAFTAIQMGKEHAAQPSVVLVTQQAL